MIITKTTLALLLAMAVPSIAHADDTPKVPWHPNQHIVRMSKKVINKKFFKSATYTHLLQKGMASFYGVGDGFQGARTASGKRFDTYKAMCAHPYLPFGTVIKIVNLKTNASAFCSVADRGPFSKNRILDMSYAVKKLILGKAGTGLIAIYVP